MNRQSPAVTIGIPFHNSERTLTNAVRSVFAQTFEDWELILIDDGSTDSSLEIASALKDPRVQVMSDGRNLTLAPRLNQIAEMASAPLLARMDADDLMHPQRIEKQVRFLGNHPEVDIVGTGVYSIDSHYSPRGKRGLGVLDRRPFSIAISGLFIHPSILGRTSWFLNNPYNEEAWACRAEDYDLWLRTMGNSRFAVIPEPLMFYTEVVDGTLDRLRKSYKSSCQILDRAEMYGFSPAERILVKSINGLKIVGYRICWSVGLRSYLISKRNQRLSEDEVSSVKSTLEYIFSFPVSGFDISV